MFPIFSPTKILDSLILMQIVIEGPLHGYAMASSMEEKFGWKPSQTAIYNSLKAMENENLVAVEERIESGRVQKIYSITEQGQKFVEEMKQKMKKQMMKDLTHFFSFAQMIGDIDTLEESKAFQQRIQSVLENLKIISHMTLLLLRESPEETQKTIENTLESLKKIAAKYDVKIPEEILSV